MRNTRKIITGIIFLFLSSGFCIGQALYQFPENSVVSKVSWKFYKLKPNSATLLFSDSGQGIINRVWCSFLPDSDSINLDLSGKLKLRISWDTSETYAVDVSLADFFGRQQKLNSGQNHFFYASNSLCVFNNIIPMPYRKGATIELYNPTDKDILFWFNVDYEKKNLEPGALYFHCRTSEFKDVGMDSELVVLPLVNGKGRFIGIYGGVNQPGYKKGQNWYTRPVKIYVDQGIKDSTPSLNIHTIDDYIGSGWWSMEEDLQPYLFEYTGRPVSELKNEHLKVEFYRFHVTDPVWFSKSLRLEIGKNRWAVPRADWKFSVYYYSEFP